MPLQQTSGNVTADAYGGGVTAVTNYIEDVFSTYLYTGNDTSQTITNNINLSGNGGLVWTKGRTNNPSTGLPGNHYLFDTIRGVNQAISTNTTEQSYTRASSLTAFNSDGFSVGNNGYSNGLNQTYASWTFREQAKFFDVVTWTGSGANRTIAHNLGSVPGCIIVKRTDTISDWQVYHSSLANTQYIVLNTTAAVATGATRWNSTTPTSSVFSVGIDATVNASGGTYVAYVFASNAGGFGLTNAVNVISCGSYTGNGSATGPVVSLGYEPQWVMVKASSTTGNWVIEDTMRGMSQISSNELFPNTSGIETALNPGIIPTATGFTLGTTNADMNSTGVTYIYIAIRRGPMKVPTDATKVFGLNARTGTGANATVTGSAGVSDAVLIKNRGAAVGDLFASRLTGTGYMSTDGTGVENAAATTVLQANPWDVMDGVKVGTTSTVTNASANTFINYLINRAPKFFDVVCYTGTGVARTISHNLAAVPELMIVKSRSAINAWQVYSATVGPTKNLQLNTTNVPATVATMWNNTQPTSSVFTLGSNITVNTTSDTYIAYLFATCAGVSKVGSYTGTGATQTIDCGFAAGARWVLIKRIDSTGDWYVWDTARGMVSGTDPSLLLNSSAAEVNANSIYTTTGGLQIVSTAAGINASGGAYIFLAIA